MRSTLKTIAFATVALSLATGGAFAADHTGHAGHNGNHEHHASRYDRDHDYDYFGPQPPVEVMPVMTYTSRLDRILNGVSTAENTIRQDRNMHRLSASASMRLEREANTIRNRAEMAAGTHGGTLSDATFRHLQAAVGKLDRDIIRLT